MKKLPIPSKKELESLYLEKKYSISQLASHYNAHRPTVRKWLKDYEITIRSHKEACNFHILKNVTKRPPSKEELQKYYSDCNLKQLQAIYNVGQTTIYEWLDLYEIERKTIGESVKKSKELLYKDKQIEKEVILNTYETIKNVPMTAEALNISYSHLKKLIKDYGIILNSFRSKAEIELFNLIDDGSFTTNNRNVIAPYELDMYSEQHKLAIEYCGLYWHSEYFGQKKKDYHLLKQKMCAEKGIKLITVFESDDFNKVKALINKLTGRTKKIYARKTKLIELTSKIANEFHKEHHLSNAVPASLHYGLEDSSGNLLMVVSFSKARFNKKYEYECARMTSHSDVQVIGGASKLFKHFLSIHKSCITYADLRFGSGDVYKHCGLIYKGISPPNYWYFHKYRTNHLYSRVQFQKHKLSKLDNYHPDLTEFEIMKLNGYDRIWDCGNAVYVSHI